MSSHPAKPAVHLAWLLVSCLSAAGCQSFFEPVNPLPISPVDSAIQPDVPREKVPVSLPSHAIEPPDVLLIDAVKIVPKSPYTIDTLDILGIQAPGAPPEQPIAAAYTVDGAGNVDLGPAYGKVKVIGRTVEEAKTAIKRHLSQKLERADVSVSLLQLAGAQQITGQHLVGPDGMVNLLSYGMVQVAGLTTEEAARKIERHLSEFLESPKVIVDVLAYNSKVYYIITEGAGLGDNVVRRPITGNEMVLDAIASIGGLSQLSSQKMWISRPAPGNVGYRQILPINWKDITRSASSRTNYQLLPGDRLYIAEDKLRTANSIINKVVQPFERIFGFIGLGTNSLNAITRFGLSVNSPRR